MMKKMILPFTKFSSFDIEIHGQLATILLQRSVAPYVALDIIDLLAADIFNNMKFSNDRSYQVESWFMHLRKITLLEQVQSRLAARQINH